jgi:hypothetical protein
MGIAENEVVVDFLYKVRWQGKLIWNYFPTSTPDWHFFSDKNFRLRFSPQRPR